jgi:DNA-binding LacI/PurR family transcriptional regulator
MGAVTLETIARELGVSKMTVSNAYNRPDQLGPELRARILETARRLEYPGPNPLASTLRKGRTGTFGVIFDDPLSYAFTDPAAVLFLQGMAEACELRSTGLLLIPSAPGSDEAVATVQSALVDGFAIYSDFEGDRRAPAAYERGLRTVLIDTPPVPGYPWVGIDERAAARLAAKHLLQLGHRRLGVVTLPFSTDGYCGWVEEKRTRVRGYQLTRERLSGYREEVLAAGVAWDTVLVYEQQPHSVDSGRRAAAALLDRAERPSAILAMSDELAIGVLLAARERGIDVPGGLSIVGFDDAPSAVHSAPQLTTIHQPLVEKGRVAARLLLDPETRDERVELPVELKVRASTAPAPTQEGGAHDGDPL